MDSGISIQHQTCNVLRTMRPLLWLLALLIVSSSALRAQADDKWLEKGVAAYQDHDYVRAKEYLQWSIDHGGGWQSKLAMADCHRAQKDYAAAAKWYAQIMEEPGIPARAYFYYGQALMTSRRYADAEKWFARYAQVAATDPLAAQFRNIEKLVASVKGDTLEFVVERMPINSTSSDFGPMLFEGGLLFISARPNDLGVKHVSTLDDAPLLDLYYSKPDSQGRWSRPALMHPLNTKLNEGPMAMDLLRQELFITRNDIDHKANRDRNERQSLNRLRIDRLERTDGKWIAKGGMPFNNTAYAVGHPTLTVTGDTMYFASDMPGGIGGTDIYRCHRTGDTWSAPVNLGATINTSEDELFPYHDGQGQLYFSSDGHLGLGGLDLFSTQMMPTGTWSRVQNLGYPINSEADDFGIVLDRSGNLGYFASNRGKAPENDDIYAFLRDWPRFECQPMIENNYCFAYIDEGFLDIDTLPFVYEWSFGDGQKQRAEEGYHCYDGPGVYQIEFNIIDTLLNTIFMRQSDYTLVVKDTPQVTINVPDTVAIDQQLAINAEGSVFAGCEIQRYYWELGDGTRGRGATLPHAYTEAGTYTIKLGVTGLPNEDGSLVCKNCVTKQLTVVTPAKLKQIEMQRMKAREARQALPELPTFLPSKNPEVPQIEMPSPANVEDGKFSVSLSTSSTPMNPLAAPYKGLQDLREVRTTEGYTVYQGSEDSLHGIIPYWVQAKRLGFEDAVVVMLPNSPGVDGIPTRSTTIPLRRSTDGIALFLGEIKDAEGNPLKATITIEDFSKSRIIFQKETDSLGKIELRLPDGKVYAWTAELTDYMPASGLLDLTIGSELEQLTEKLQRQITLKKFQELAESGEPIVINNIFFDFDSDNLRPESVGQIQRIARVLIEHPEFGLMVSAHTDNVGNDSYNLDLSHRRAYAVLKYMIAAGYDVDHISSIGYGETRPSVPNDSPQNRQLNRRIEFTLHVLSNPAKED